ncbi:MAG: hypothetical protein JRG94_03240 [Deltaproteobacteria bacterium]|nr:hypothetical protein [Deltaproteobacteria bacterium]
MAKKGVVTIWIVAAVASAALVGLLWRPFLTAWTCYSDWSTGTVDEGEVVEATPETGLVLRFAKTDVEGEAETCTAYLGVTRLEDYEIGDKIIAYRRADRPGVCEQQATIDAARALLSAVAATVVAALLFAFLIAKVVSRSLTKTPTLTTRFEPIPTPFPCPRCAKPMEEGYLPLVAGIHWRQTSEPIGLPHALAGLPGTVGWLGRPRVHAYRCEACTVVIFRYGA